MELINRFKALYRVKSIKVIEEHQDPAKPYRYRVVYDDDPLSFTFADEVIYSKSRNGDIVTKASTGSVSRTNDRCKTTVWIWS